MCGLIWHADWQAICATQHSQSRCVSKVQLISSVYGRARNNADHRVQHFLETRFDINIDTTPLFNWNTKQVFLSLTASYDLPEHGRTDVVIWDRIVRDKDTARVKRKNVRNKYGMRELSRSFENVTSVDLRVEWNVMPYVGIMQRGVTPRSEPFAIAQDPELKMRPPVILPY